MTRSAGPAAAREQAARASRYDKLTVNCRGGDVLRAILIWTNDLCVTPLSLSPLWVGLFPSRRMIAQRAADAVRTDGDHCNR